MTGYGNWSAILIFKPCPNFGYFAQSAKNLFSQPWTPLPKTLHCTKVAAADCSDQSPFSFDQMRTVHTPWASGIYLMIHCKSVNISTARLFHSEMRLRIWLLAIFTENRPTLTVVLPLWMNRRSNIQLKEVILCINDISLLVCSILQKISTLTLKIVRF
jgi:hypothetical protein